MIKTILWDFDGVILNSMKIKGDGFVELFKQYDPHKVKELEKFHYENGGVSRFDKIKYFFNIILEEEIKMDEVLKLADKFGKIIEKKIYNDSNLINDSLSYIKKNYKQFNFHIVSGAEHTELNKLCNSFKLTGYFISINGSPTQKEILVQDVIEKYKYGKEETILIGDAMGDYTAAKKNGIAFFGYNNTQLKKLGNYIESFLELTL